MDRDLVRISKRLSKILRHAPDSAGITLDAAGWVPVHELLAALERIGPPVTAAQFEAVVRENDKRRFAVRTGPDGVRRVRASQGHSARVPVALGLAPATPPAWLYHGTVAANLPSIRAEGLRPGRRHHVHLSGDRETALRVGRRRSGPVAVLLVRSGAMAGDGYEFHLSENGVWLTAHVPPGYLAEDEQQRSGEDGLSHRS